MTICYALSTTIIDFLQLEVVPLPPLQLASLSTTKQKRQPRPSNVTSRDGNKREQVIQAMQLALEEEQPPPCLTSLALRLGFKTYRSLTTYSKCLSAAISARYADYQQQLSVERIRSILESTLDSDEYPHPP